MYGVSDDRCTGFSAVCWLWGSSMAGLMAVLFVPLFFVLLSDARLLLLSPCTYV